jgi:integrase
MVVDEQDKRLMEVYDLNGRLEGAKERLLRDKQIHPENKEKILQFTEYLKSEGRSIPTQLKYLVRLTRLALMLNKEFSKCNRDDVKDVVVAIKSKPDWSENTKEGYKIALKVFFPWLRGCDDEEDEEPEETRWIKIQSVESKPIDQNDLLTEEDVNKILECAKPNPRDLAMIESLDEAGERAGELLTAGVGDVVLDELGAIVYARAKRKKTRNQKIRRIKRRIRLIKSAKSLAKWLEVHPLRNDENAPLWPNLSNYHRYKPLRYEAARKIIQDYAKKAGIKKKVNFLNFRHSTISRTVSMNKLKQPALCALYDWEQGSRMPSTYIHLFGDDNDEALKDLYGLSAPKEQKTIPSLKECPRCREKNQLVAEYCIRCGGNLDIMKIREIDERKMKAERILNSILEDPEIQAIILEKLKKKERVDS